MLALRHVRAEAPVAADTLPLTDALVGGTVHDGRNSSGQYCFAIQWQGARSYRKYESS